MHAARAALVDQIAVAWRHKLTFLGRGVKPLGLERDVGVRDARGGPVGVGDEFAAVGGDHLGWQAEQHVARVANFDRRSLARFVEALEILRPPGILQDEYRRGRPFRFCRSSRRPRASGPWPKCRAAGCCPGPSRPAAARGPFRWDWLPGLSALPLSPWPGLGALLLEPEPVSICAWALERSLRNSTICSLLLGPLGLLPWSSLTLALTLTFALAIAAVLALPVALSGSFPGIALAISTPLPEEFLADCCGDEPCCGCCLCSSLIASASRASFSRGGRSGFSSASAAASILEASSLSADEGELASC